MSVSILIPTYNRKKFSKLICYNINIQLYKNIKEIIVIDDGDDNEKLDLSLIQNKSIKIIYKKLKQHITIGDKRNQLIKLASSKYCCFMDTDDIYYDTYISSSIELLETNKNKYITGSADMLFYFKDKQKTGQMCCIGLNMLHEASLVFSTKFIKKNMKFSKSSSGEGKSFLNGYEKFIIENKITNIMVCVAHSDNTIDKSKWFRSHFDSMELGINRHLDILNKI